MTAGTQLTVFFLELGDILELFGQRLWFACIYLGVVVRADYFGKSNSVVHFAFCNDYSLTKFIV